MEINSSTINPVTSGYSTTTSAEDNGIMNKDDFLKLFLASLQFQDPMSPMESKDMMAQMSQLTMVEQITNLGKVVENLKETMQPNPLETGVNFLGKDVSGITSSGELVEGKVSEVEVNNGILELIVNNKNIEIGNISKVANYSTYNS